MARDVEAGRAFLKMFLEDSALKRGLTGISSRLRSVGTGITKFGGGIAAVGTAAAAAFIPAIKSAASYGDELDKASARTGVGVTSLQALALQAAETGASLNDVERAIVAQTRAMARFGEGGGLAKSTLRDLKTTYQELEQLSPEQLFRKLVDSINDVESASRRSQLVIDVFGRAGAQLGPLIAGGTEGLDIAAKRIEQLGGGASELQTQNAAAFVDAWGRVTFVVKSVVQQIGFALIPTLASVADKLALAGATVVKWARDNQSLIATVAAVSAGIAVFGGIIVAVGTSALIASIAVTAFSSALGVAATVVAFVVSPLGLVVVAVGAVGAALVAGAAYFTFYTTTGQQAVAGLVGRFKTLLGGVKDTVGGVANALIAGDVSLAVDIFWNAIELAWQKGQNDVLGSTKGWLGAILAVYEQWAPQVTAPLQAALSPLDSFIKDSEEKAKQLTAIRKSLLADARGSAQAKKDELLPGLGDKPSFGGIDEQLQEVKVKLQLPASSQSVFGGQNAERVLAKQGDIQKQLLDEQQDSNAKAFKVLSKIQQNTSALGVLRFA